MPPAPTFARVDHLVIAVHDLTATEEVYTALLGLEPSWRGTHPALGTRNVIFGVTGCSIELLAPEPGTPHHPAAAALQAYLAHKPEGLFAIALGTDDVHRSADALHAAGLPRSPISDGEAIAAAGAVRRWRSFTIARQQARGVNVVAIEHETAGAVPRAAPTATASTVVSGVDHVVVFSDDLEGALRLWRDTFAIPERWRREFPERGTINVGLRLAGVTLELVAPRGAAAGERGERLWGVAYVVRDCDGTVARLRAAGIPVSDARAGLAPATRVATVKWTDHVPTLLLEHTERGTALRS